VDDGDAPAVGDVQHGAEDLRAVAVRRQHGADDERQVDAREAERLRGDGHAGQHDRRGETPEEDGWKVHCNTRSQGTGDGGQVVVVAKISTCALSPVTCDLIIKSVSASRTWR